MKAKVLSKMKGKLKILLEDSRILIFEADVAKLLNPALQWGDTGELFMDDSRGRMRFIIDAVENDLTPVPPADIITPLLKEEDYVG